MRKSGKKRSRKKETKWGRLYELADAVIGQTIADLPEAVKAEAENVPCLLEKWTDEDLDPDTLGFCAQMEEGFVSEAPGPIVLYLGRILEYCREEGLDFTEEVRITFLHELGHHLGWDEDDVESRGL